ncbi:hypothetical protein CMQ_3265 [Grosmannia clavigera kw1407]|uniref:Uncharacterized protein n=1 Tax=Grosmannia clavigera (strain kw1407 / UAMH 11150) TaxID=655863 RepID=F0XHP5_GROCL|nr:uncharacterized protein CMQ_3265 [Grosmannia clavigera kw1407]EFX03336.1 hypothetical protein CMQ_3265 [Grosmannia clavigera kw1407]
MAGICHRPLFTPPPLSLGSRLMRTASATTQPTWPSSQRPTPGRGFSSESDLRLGASAGPRQRPAPLQQQKPQKQQRAASTSQRRVPPRRRGEMSPSVGMAQMNATRTASLISFRIPHTFVPPPMTQYLSSPGTFAKLFWYRLKTRATDAMSELSVRLQSKPGFFQGGRFKPHKKALVPMAQTMHAQMLEATAAGDTATLGRLLTHSHMDEVAGLIARRPRGRRCQWELLSYQGRPRLVDSKVVMIPGPTSTYIRQIVVSIRSRQRFTWFDDRTAKPGTGPSPLPAPSLSVVEKDAKENVVLVASLDRSTWETSEWRIFGFMPETTVESWEDEVRLVDQATKDGSTIG